MLYRLEVFVLPVTDVRDRGVEVAGPFHFGDGGQADGVHPARDDFASFASFDDPDGNTWLVQEVPSRGGAAWQLS